jgi:uncharacterized protein YwgA
MEPRHTTPLDAYLLLAAASHFRGGRTQNWVQKALYCAEDDAERTGGCPLPAFHFFRWNNGPYSKEVANTASRLAELGLMREKGGPLTARGRRVVEEVRRYVAAYPVAARALEAVEAYAERFSGMRLPAVLAEVYDREVESPFGVMKVGKVPRGSQLIEREVPGAVLADLKELQDLIWWIFSQSEEEAHAEAESPLAPEVARKAFLDRYLI